MKTLELICWAEERHKYYCQLASKFLDNFDKSFKHPRFQLFASKSRYAGWARHRAELCGYNLSFLLAAEEEFEQTIAHEVAHFVIRDIKIDAKPHGELFMFILHDVFYCRAERYHDYHRQEKHVVQAIALMKLVDLNKVELKDAAERSSR